MADYYDDFATYVMEASGPFATLIVDLKFQLTKLQFAAAPYIRPVFELAQSAEESLPTFAKVPIAAIAAIAIVLHVANYNATAHLEYRKRYFEKIFGRGAAIYIYAVYLILSALVRDHYVMQAVESDVNSLVLFPHNLASTISKFLIFFGVFLNLWTLKALGVKGMYNGDSFGHYLPKRVEDGPYLLFDHPQYVGTTLALLGYAVKFQSMVGYALTALLYGVFMVSAYKIEDPHMRRIFAEKDKKEALAAAVNSTTGVGSSDTPSGRSSTTNQNATGKKGSKKGRRID
ncbi:phospholipid methyltransferase-domain-containing protein [Fimicolochytrium jonesii]|uniref:phospholipid methyltransferase-domain-containing protein n=1 Tax=Fimicolochytrium jonesii TaxID=1396493 RepID=UPI0022FF1AB4|nr:phospholipid methyltransferase-domain-containing protein [Fimicolochytrium jonesii]KAI8826572.1 phospholipid methyltransferase-domain-containing protein [Fimicolochytrium jonesii]